MGACAIISSHFTCRSSSSPLNSSLSVSMYWLVHWMMEALSVRAHHPQEQLLAARDQTIAQHAARLEQCTAPPHSESPAPAPPSMHTEVRLTSLCCAVKTRPRCRAASLCVQPRWSRASTRTTCTRLTSQWAQSSGLCGAGTASCTVGCILDSITSHHITSHQACIVLSESSVHRQSDCASRPRRCVYVCLLHTVLDSNGFVSSPSACLP